ncbi:MAG: hypothetical protein ACYTBJ_06525 [Planctomycetota bacterium]|jgi:hypothetical protein
MKGRKISTVFVQAIVLVFATAAFCENIDPNEDGSQYAHGENIGWVNFEPNLAEPNVGATVTSEKLTGFVWSESIGWINLDPNDSDPNTGIANDSSGNLSGFAWGEGVGWINFDPNVPGDANDYGVIIDGNGDFGGWAWGENIGWINFSSPDLYGYNVKACKVNLIDLGNFVDDWLQSGVGLPGDLSGNDRVDFVDYGMFADYWLCYCADDWALK